MKLFDVLFGRTRDKKPKIEDFFSVSTAGITLEAVGFKPSGKAGICFKPIESSSFSYMEEELIDLLRISISESGTKYEIKSDEYGYTWVILEDKDFEDLVTTTHLINETLIDHGFGGRLLCSVFEFGNCYLIYNYKQGKFYPFAPKENRNRDEKLEFRLKSLLKGELPLEEEMERWFPIWGIPF
ncbi:MAG: PspA-associated protein PspAB [Candidatus Syntropharchaeia archaeon]